MRRLLMVVGLLAPGLAGPAWSQPIPARVEFQVNTYTTYSQDDPWVSRAPSGEFVVVWESREQDGDLEGIFAQRLDATGAPLGPEFQVNTYTTYQQYDPRVAVNASGSFVVVWESFRDGSYDGVFARRYDSTGAPLDLEFQVNTYTMGTQSDPAIAADPSGGFVVAWLSNGQDGHLAGIFARRYDSTGAPLGFEFQVNTYTTGPQYSPRVALDTAGSFVVAWESYGQDGSGGGIFAQRYDPTEIPLGGEFQVNTYTTGGQYNPSLAASPSGEFVIVWESDYQDGDGQAVIGRHFDPSGASLGGEFLVNTTTLNGQADPVVAVDRFGNAAVVWEDTALDGSEGGVFSQRFTSPLRIAVTSPGDLGMVDCSDPRNIRPTITWAPGEYDRFRVFVGSSPGFEKGTRVTSGDTLLRTTSWTPTTKKWRSACARALAADPNNPILYVRVFGLDGDTGQRDPERKYTSEPVRAVVGP